MLPDVTFAPVVLSLLPSVELLLDVVGVESTNPVDSAFAFVDVTPETEDEDVTPAAVSNDEMPELMLTNSCRSFTSHICVM